MAQAPQSFVSLVVVPAAVRVAAAVQARAGIANRVGDAQHAQIIAAEIFICRRESAQ